MTNRIDTALFGHSFDFVRAPFSDAVKAAVAARQSILHNLDKMRLPRDRLALPAPEFYGPMSASDKARYLFPFARRGFRTWILSEAQEGWCCLWANNQKGVIDRPDLQMAAEANRWPYLRVALFKEPPSFSLQFLYQDFSQSSETMRVIYLHRESRLTFKTIGTPLPFEDLVRYKARRFGDRFSVDVIADYCRHLGIGLLDEAFHSGPFAKQDLPHYLYSL